MSARAKGRRARKRASVAEMHLRLLQQRPVAAAPSVDVAADPGEERDDER